MDVRPGMFRSWRSIAWLLLASVAFYAYAFKLFPLLTSAVLAAVSGVALSIGVGTWIRQRHERRRDEWEFDEMIRREAAAEELRDSIKNTGDRNG